MYFVFLYLNRLGKVLAMEIFFKLFHEAHIYRTPQLSKCINIKIKLCDQFFFSLNHAFFDINFISFQHKITTAGWFFFDFDSLTHE